MGDAPLPMKLRFEVPRRRKLDNGVAARMNEGVLGRQVLQLHVCGPVREDLEFLGQSRRSRGARAVEVELKTNVADTGDREVDGAQRSDERDIGSFDAHSNQPRRFGPLAHDDDEAPSVALSLDERAEIVVNLERHSMGLTPERDVEVEAPPNLNFRERADGPRFRGPNSTALNRASAPRRTRERDENDR